ncbi:MAG: GDYXXLXY domain-containing protein [Rhodobacteraceae bacterium]|nr:GDYXXLXY domain-containing protein [Paracoccaceae bacterium]
MSRFLIAGTILAALLQTGVLAKIITDRAAALQSGQEVLLETGFIDPRDLFRGHYAVLNLQISRIDRNDVTLHGRFTWNDPVYVALDTSGPFARPVSLHDAYPADFDGPVIKGNALFTSDSTNQALRIDFPFNRFFAPLDRALELENLRREQKLGVILALSKDGSGMIKGLTIEGEKFYEAPLY